MGKITYGELKRGAVNLLKNASIANPALDVRLLLEKVSHKTAADLITCDREMVPEPVQVEFQELLGARLAREPMAYILGEKAFWSLDFVVNEHVLIPRPETEGVMERVLELIGDFPKPRILDIGTGSGALLISLLNELDGASGTGVDISPEALKVARINAKRCKVSDRCMFYSSDYLENVIEKYDIIISNPPYIDDKAMAELMPDVGLYEPELALHGGADGLDAYRIIIPGLTNVLKPGGYVVFEIGYDQKYAVSDLLAKEGAKDIICQQDIAGLDRIISATF